MEKANDAQLQKYYSKCLEVKKWMLNYPKQTSITPEIKHLKLAWTPMLTFLSLELTVYIGYTSPDNSAAIVERFGNGNFNLGTTAICHTCFGSLYQLESKSSRYIALIPEIAETFESLKERLKLIICAIQYASEFNKHNLKGTNISFAPTILLQAYNGSNAVLKGQKLFLAAEIMGKFAGDYTLFTETDETFASFSHYTFSYSFGDFLIDKAYGMIAADKTMYCVLPNIQTGINIEGICTFFQAHKCSTFCHTLGLFPFDTSSQSCIGESSKESETPSNLVLSSPPTEEIKKLQPVTVKQRRSADIIVKNILPNTTPGQLRSLLSPLAPIKKVTVVKKSAFVWLHDPIYAEKLVATSRFLKFGFNVVELAIPNIMHK